MLHQQFGGPWTEQKLKLLKAYLQQYLMIFHTNERARFLRTIYVDAFAGTGAIETGRQGNELVQFVFEGIDENAKQMLKGSALIALELEPGFDEYLFIEKSNRNLRHLQQLLDSFVDKKPRTYFRHGDSNQELSKWCEETNWKRNRAVVFLDPFGMEVEWNTIVQLAETQSIDLWLLFPLGISNRLLKSNEPPPPAWAERLDKTFGSNEWRDRFYKQDMTTTLFGEESHVLKDVDFLGITKYVVERLGSIFAGVAPKPLVLRNTRGTPIFLLCFASGNPKGASTAIRIAKHLLEKW